MTSLALLLQDNGILSQTVLFELCIQIIKKKFILAIEDRQLSSNKVILNKKTQESCRRPNQE